jgi:glycosyltransferase involved in cell wall biosynthesis
MKADLHVHSKHSDRPSEWFLRRIGAPECFTEPADLYRVCRQKGMDFVTITDHNCIRGALEIAHLPGTFVSVELTTYFPEDGCKIHCLAYGITETQFAELQSLRENIYHLRDYLRDHDILHSVAHPLFRINDRLTPEHVEKLLVLFNRFEAVNGSRHPRAGNLAVTLFSNLTRELLAGMADRHGLQPVGETPWIKRFTGGSDDHSGVHAAGAYTVTPAAGTVEEFLAHLRAGAHEPGGSHGTSLRLAHSLYHIAYSYYRARLERPNGGASVLGEVFRRFIEGSAPEPEAKPGKLRAFGETIVRRHRLRKLSPAERLLAEEFTRLRRCPPGSGPAPRAAGPDLECFESASRLGHELGYLFTRQLCAHLSDGRFVDGLQSLASLGAVALGMAPYFTAFGLQHKDEPFLRDLATRYPAGQGLRRRSSRRAWITDTFADVNGVAHAIRSFSAHARERGNPITVFTSLPAMPDADVLNFPPLGEFVIPEYETLKLSFPPFLHVIEALERGNFHELIISTPGPMGLCALAAARLLGLRVTGIYHTDFPGYIRCLTGDEYLEQLAWGYMRWFYGGMDRVHAPTECYRRSLADHGLDPARLGILPRGVDTTLFSPAKRDPALWQRYGLNGNFKLLYVGRVSREKNVGSLIEAYRALRATRKDLDLVIVGEGPDYNDMRQRHARDGVVFTGFLRGEDLARAYAAADLFVFPSATDTFGNAVLEALASGVPAVVSDQGGPSELVARHAAGLAVDTRAPGPLAAAIADLIQDPARRGLMAERALQTAREHTWDAALDRL